MSGDRGETRKDHGETKGDRGETGGDRGETGVNRGETGGDRGETGGNRGETKGDREETGGNRGETNVGRRERSVVRVAGGRGVGPRGGAAYTEPSGGYTEPFGGYTESSKWGEEAEGRVGERWREQRRGGGRRDSSMGRGGQGGASYRGTSLTGGEEQLEALLAAEVAPTP